MSSLVLDKKYFLAKGGERTCYIHPHDETKVIKVLHVRGKHNNQNELRLFIYTVFTKIIIKIYHNLQNAIVILILSKGKGLVFEAYCTNFDQSYSKSFRYMLAHQIMISLDEQEDINK